jgi:hypothetical protein
VEALEGRQVLSAGVATLNQVPIMVYHPPGPIYPPGPDMVASPPGPVVVSYPPNPC